MGSVIGVVKDLDYSSVGTRVWHIDATRNQGSRIACPKQGVSLRADPPGLGHPPGLVYLGMKEWKRKWKLQSWVI